MVFSTFFEKRYRQKLHDFLPLRTWPFRSSPQWASTAMHGNVHLPRNLCIRGLRDLRSDTNFLKSSNQVVLGMLSIRNSVETTFGESQRHEDETHVCQIPPELASWFGIPVPNSTETGFQTSEIIPQLLHSDSDFNGFLELVWDCAENPVQQQGSSRAPSTNMDRHNGTTVPFF